MIDGAISDLTMTALERAQSFKITREVDRYFIDHLMDIHLSQRKPVSEMWPCHRERLLTMAHAQIVEREAIRPNPEGVTR